ncbi:hypothetical protein FACS1894151_10570 [Spirochaetia bacterium]|nr:hypothetical protein FACS1894151_10570 [Spirochaetia bacterium]
MTYYVYFYRVNDNHGTVSVGIFKSGKKLKDNQDLMPLIENIRKAESNDRFVIENLNFLYEVQE